MGANDVEPVEVPQVPRVYLNPQLCEGSINHLGDENWWVWFWQESGFDCRFDPPDHRLGPGEVMIHYSLRGHCPERDRSICLCWEMYPEMVQRLGRQWTGPEAQVYAGAATCRWHTVPTPSQAAYYDRFGPIDVIPIGVDTDLFRPASPAEKDELRRRYQIPVGQRCAFWLGWRHSEGWPSAHKGPDLKDAWKATHQDWHLIEVDKDRPRPQAEVADLMRCSDAWLNTSRLEPYYLTDWECMASDLPRIDAEGALRREFEVKDSPRGEVFARGWSRHQTLPRWQEYVEERAR